MKGEGIWRGSRVNPTARKAARSANTASGMTNLSAFIASPTGLARHSGSGSETRLRHRFPRAVAPVGERDEAADRHDEAAAPDPVDEGLVVDAHAPRVGVH